MTAGRRSAAGLAESAFDFWRAMGCQIVHDGRTADPPEPSVHFELALLPARA